MIKVYKTFEIDDHLWEQIVDGFNESFDLHFDIHHFKDGMSISNPWGYSYHAVAIDDETGDLKGFNTYYPYLYKNGLKFLVSGDVFVRKKYRKDIFLFLDMLEDLRTVCVKDGFVVALGVPNHNALDYSIKFLGSKLVGFLDYYTMPVHPSNCLSKPYLKPFDCIAKYMVIGYVSVHTFLSKIFNPVETEVKYALEVNDNYLKARFGDSVYHKYQTGDIIAYYRIMDENSIKTAYLLDFREKNIRTKRALAKAVSYIVKYDCPDAVLFVGFLRLKQHVLFKVPKRFIPKPLPLVCGVINKSRKKDLEDISDKNNWNFSLMNFDVR